jgi:hypothetical protein
LLAGTQPTMHDPVGAGPHTAGEQVGEDAIDPGEPEQATGSAARGDVAAKLRHAQTIVERGERPLDDRITVGDFLDRWLAGVVKPRRSHGHWRNCEAYCRLHVKPAVGRVPLAKLTPADVERLIPTTRDKGLSVAERLRAGAAWEAGGFVFTGPTGRPLSPQTVAR